MITQYIPDIFAAIVTKVSTTMQALPVKPYPVFFDFGHYREVTKNLKWKDDSHTLKDKKYPLIWLVMDFDESMGESPADYARLKGLQFIIANATNPTWTMRERRDNNFLPYLYPVFAEFIRQITDSVELGMPPESKLQFTKTDRPYWGGSQDTLGNNQANLFNDFIDAIQIRNFKLNIKQKMC